MPQSIKTQLSSVSTSIADLPTSWNPPSGVKKTVDVLDNLGRKIRSPTSRKILLLSSLSECRICRLLAMIFDGSGGARRTLGRQLVVLMISESVEPSLPYS